MRKIAIALLAASATLAVGSARAGAGLAGVAAVAAVAAGRRDAAAGALVCARVAAARMTPLERCELKRAQDESEAFVRRGAGDYADFNLEFHCLIYSGTHNGFLKEHALSLRSRMAAFRQAQLHDAGRLAISFREHGLIVDAIVQGDSEQAAKLMRAHLINASVSLERYARPREERQADDK